MEKGLNVIYQGSITNICNSLLLNCEFLKDRFTLFSFLNAGVYLGLGKEEDDYIY